MYVQIAVFMFPQAHKDIKRHRVNKIQDTGFQAISQSGFREYADWCICKRKKKEEVKGGSCLGTEQEG